MNFSQVPSGCKVCLTKKGKIMADKNERLPQNVAGPYYVDSSCTDCDLCRNIAPEFFRRDDEIGMSVVYHQPVTPEEHALAEEAKEGCPTDSIGNDGTAAIDTIPARDPNFRR
jgi:ferredoxin